MKSIVLLAIALFLSAACAEKHPIERYQPIIDRQMFGPLPTDFDPSKSPNEVQKSSSKDEKKLTQEQEKLKSSIHFSVINVTPEGATTIGFTDNSSPKAPKHYFLKVGESRDGWTVKKANAEDATMTIEKDGIVVSLSLGDNSAKGEGTTQSGGTAASATAANAEAGHPGLLSGKLFGSASLRGKRLLREEEARAAAAKRQEELDAKDREIQLREAERQQQLQDVIDEMKKINEAAKASAAKASAAKSEENGEGDASDNVE